ncbi:DUF6892 domain-containing protein [Nocardioides litoris]|uniref:DUF6892 domain-containing protein n=1 Tax=Nocardioides litoris TaxID=1926648 RepID=UPI00111F04F3|nr:hypothetical protein [Nocardioides litoris]
MTDTPAAFTDSNLKLAVVQVLMYDKGLIQPEFDVHDFVAQHTDRAIDVDAEGHAPIPEVRAWFDALEVPTALLAEVDEIYMDGGNEVYLQVAPRWDGEDGAFDVERWDDLDLLPALESITVMGGDEEVVEQLRARGLDADLL